MKVFYSVLFCGIGLFNVIAAALDIKWYMDYMARNAPARRIQKRITVAVIGLLLVLYGAALLAGWI